MARPTANGAWNGDTFILSSVHNFPTLDELQSRPLFEGRGEILEGFSLLLHRTTNYENTQPFTKTRHQLWNHNTNCKYTPPRTRIFKDFQQLTRTSKYFKDFQGRSRTFRDFQGLSKVKAQSNTALRHLRRTKIDQRKIKEKQQNQKKKISKVSNATYISDVIFLTIDHVLWK